MTYELKDDEISLFKNDRREKDSDPLYKGSGKAGGVEVWANAWINESRNGTKYMKIKLKPKQEPIPTGPIKDIILGSFVNNAEGRARHCYENFVIQNLNGNFRSHESGQVHVCPAF